MSMSIPVIFVFVLAYAIMLFLQMKRKKSLSNFNIETEYKNAERYTNEICSEQLSDLKQQMKGVPIDAITQCAHISSLKNQMTVAAINAVKKVAWSAIGVRAKYRAAPRACFLVLSNRNLHYLFFEMGEIKQHLILDEMRMVNARIDMVSTVDKISRLQSVSGRKTRKLIFDIDNIPMEILFYDFISETPNGIITGKDVYLIQAKCIILGKYFIEKLGKDYPHLNMVV